jgi:hypothetical protein
MLSAYTPIAKEGIMREELVTHEHQSVRPGINYTIGFR